MPETTWQMLESERTSFADYLDGLSPGDWDKPSLCSDWTVKDLVAHVVAGSKSTPPRFLGDLASSGFNFHKATAKALRREVDRPPAELAGTLRANAARKTQPGRTMVGETVVHSEDVRRALGHPSGQHPQERLLALAEHFKKAGGPVPAKKRIAGLQLKATDAEWSTGDGPVVSGPLLSLILAMTGRRVALSDLGGPGLAELTRRL
jgi:uncharacterized protein (TIGR03083 family)